jgi:CO/xanthine dehydrogenase Mo-binding subunit
MSHVIRERAMKTLAAVFAMFLFIGQANAIELADLSNREAAAGLKDALIQASGAAVGKLGVTDGFFKNPKVKIPLPDSLKKAEKAMRYFGMGKQADELVLRMNRAAETAVPEAKLLLIDAVKKMSVQDAKDILTGADDAATQYFKKVTSTALTAKFLPMVKEATQDVQLAQQYNKFAETGMQYGLVKKDQANLEQYVTQKTLDGLYLMMAEEEKAIRKDPLGASTNLIKKVFGAIN